MISFLKLIRYQNLLMILITLLLTRFALIPYFVETEINSFNFILFVINILVTAASGYIINDILDLKADKINKPNKVFIDKIISKENAYKVYGFCVLLVLIISLLISTEIIHYYIFLSTPLLLFIYSKYLKKIVLIGNITVSILVVLPIYLVFIYYFPLETKIFTFDKPANYALFFYIFFAFVTNLIREIIKDIEDIDGDLQINAKTLPIVLGRKRAKKLTTLISIILLFSLIQITKNHFYVYPIFLGYSFVFLLIPIAFFTYKLWNAETKKEFHFLSNFMKLIMFVGILSMILIKFI